ncbi:MAG: hypothetical protein COA57_08665 [Flavobacteriales bacterium]|nr:MAG: hypothetical protein COA57_08665 [Flavobacteriales bacterium]
MRLFLISISFLGIFFSGIAQQNTYYASELSVYDEALELFNKKKYSAAQKKFEQAVKTVDDANSEVSINAEYYAALCALELFHKDSEYRFKQFIQTHPESQQVKIAYFQLGKYNYRKRKWKKVIDWFGKVEIYDLANEEFPEYYFKLGYAYFMEDDFENATNAFFEIKDVDTKYTAPANYYYSHIAYSNGDNETALTGFKRLEKHPKFAPIVPYYITHIYYLQEKYEELIAYAKPLLDSANTKRVPEIARLIGDAYYRKNNYTEAIPFLERYKQETYNLTPEDEYQLGNCYYKTGHYEKAVDVFKVLVNVDGLLAQTAYYHLADCYLKTGKRKYALSAFHEAARMEHDLQIKEDALFSYAKLAYETAYDPYQLAVGAFVEYIQSYPETDRADESFNYLINVFLSTKNYKAAVRSLEAMGNLDIRLQGAYQNVAYNRAVELFSNREFVPAIAHFEKANKYPIDPSLNTQGYYWKGEAFYRIRDYDKSIANYEQYIYEPRAILQSEFANSNYNLGYAYFKKEDYKNASLWFRKYVKNKVEDTLKLNDAYLRIADSYFIRKNYSRAADFYSEAIKLKKLDTDYAMYQKAVALGTQQKQDGKIEMLEEMLASHSNSEYAVDAKFQLGKSYFFKNEYNRSLAYYNQVINKYPNSSYVKKAMLDIGQIYVNTGENDKAIKEYKRFVGSYPNYDDSRVALSQVRNIYMKTDRVEEYENYMESLAFVDLSQALLDSTTYEAPYLRYVDGNCEKAAEGFRKYLEKFENGIFALNANFYKAECEFKSKNYEDAVRGYNFVVHQPINKFTETALVKASRINFHSKNFKDALNNYIVLEEIAEYKSNILESRIGQMRCFYKLRNYDAAIDYANKVLVADKISEDVIIEAHLIGGKSALELNNLELALQEFSTTAELTTNIMGAEARYNKAYIKFLMEDYKNAEQEIYELVNLEGAYDYWIAKGLMLLADVYVSMGDLFQAKHTLQSITENYEGAGLTAIAQEKLNDIISAEQKQKELKEKEEIEIEFDDEFDMKELFEDEEMLQDTIYPMLEAEADESDL